MLRPERWIFAQAFSPVESSRIGSSPDAAITASFAYLGPADPKTQTSSFTLCRRATVPGKFRIRSILNWYDDPAVAIPAFVPVTKFRLARP